jgi:hypothetical protein
VVEDRTNTWVDLLACGHIVMGQSLDDMLLDALAEYGMDEGNMRVVVVRVMDRLMFGDR